MMKTALITGASSGIGQELARQLARDHGMRIVVAARRRDRLEQLAGEFPQGRIQAIDGDLADSSFRDRLWREAESWTGGVDVLVNNAGIGDYSPLETQSLEAIERMIAINVTALIDLTRMAVAPMKARGRGQIVQISSILGFLGIPYSAVYAATKHAVNGLVKSLRYELRGTGVHAWAACPGQTQTEFRIASSGGRISKPSGEPTEKIVRAIAREIMSGRPRRFLMPSFKAGSIVSAEHWLPRPFDWFMGSWGPKRFAAENLPNSEG